MYTYPNSLPPYTTYFTPSKSITKLSFGLFPHHSLRALAVWPHDFKILCKRLCFFSRTGLSPVSTFETFSYFTSAWRIALANLLKHNYGYPSVCPSLKNVSSTHYIEYSLEYRDYLRAEELYMFDDEAAREWQKILTRMLVLLDEMDEDNPKYEGWSMKDEDEAREKAKEEFFRILGRVWWNLWD